MPLRDALQRTYDSLVATDPDDMEADTDLMTALAESQTVNSCQTTMPNAIDFGKFRFWYPTWKDVGIFILASIGGACLMAWSPIDGLGPVSFQAAVGAIIAFEIVIICTCLRRRKKEDAELIDCDNRSGSTSDSPGAGPTLFMGLIACVLLVLAAIPIFGDGEELVPDRPGKHQDENTEALPRSPSNFIRALNNGGEWLQKSVDNFYPSLAVAIVSDGEIVFERVLGFEDVQAGRPATPQTQYHVASVTKVFTASLAVILHERGVVDLDQPVVTYLPAGVAISSTRDVGATITLRQLASHTSGLPRGVPGEVQTVEGWYELEPQRLYDHLANVELQSAPGTAEEYSNLGFGLLAHALAVAADKPFAQLIQELICNPLKLEHTAIQADGKLRPATGYAFGKPLVETKHSFKRQLAGSGGLVTSVRDLAKFLAAQMKPGVLTKEMHSQLHTETRLRDGSSSTTALGWSVESESAIGRILVKNGGRKNCSVWIGFSEKHGVGVAIVTNSGGPNVDGLGRLLLELSIPDRK